MLPIVGWQKTSLIDYPAKLSTVLFTPSCNFRCPYCHNPGLVLGDPTFQLAPREIIFDHLVKRRKVLDGVVITGGEPTLHCETLVEFTRELKALGYLVKLDSNGSNPAILSDIINSGLVDYIAMDVKTCLQKYPTLTQSSVNPKLIQRSIELLKEAAVGGKVNVEFRTTLHPLLHDDVTYLELVQLLQGAPLYVLQTFRKEITLSADFQQTTAFTEKKMLDMQKIAKLYVKTCLIR